jgi:Holliday junction DNA helicase RuvA
MYSYMQGIVTEVNPDNITLEIGGIGYQIVTPNPYKFVKDQTHKIFIYQHVREDINMLYGFESKDAKSLFIKLLGVKGIGPKSATAILASGNVNDVIGAIEVGNAKFLSKFPGIGPKASQQIILDLKGKLTFEDERFMKSSKIDEVEEALKSLGYNAREIKKAVKHLDQTKATDKLLKDALAEMLK